MGKINRWFLNIATAVVTLSAVAAVGLRARAEFLRPDPFGATRIDDWERYSSAGHSMGPANARVKIVEFADFQCPVCQTAESPLQELREQFPRDVAVIFRHFPLSIHEFALPAAHASECAAVAGRFEAFHDALFASPDSIGKEPWTSFAQRAGIEDQTTFESCMSDSSVLAAVQRDTAAGNELGVLGTPVFLINDLMVPGYPGEEQLNEYVQDALDRTRD